jgi:hypothetical protein
MLGNVALLSDVVATTTPLTNLRAVMVKNFLRSAFAFVRILVFLIMMLIFVVPFSLEILCQQISGRVQPNAWQYRTS